MSEQELTQDQLDRQDEVDNACFNFILEMSSEKSEDEGGKVEWDMETIQIIREALQEVIVDRLKLMTEMEFYPYQELKESVKVATCSRCGSSKVSISLIRDINTGKEDILYHSCDQCKSPNITVVYKKVKPDPQHKIFVVVNKGVVEKVYGPKGSDYVIIDEDTQDEDGEHEVAFRHEELDAAKEAGEVEEL